MRTLVPLAVFVAVLQAGCAEDVTAVLGTELDYSMYGVLTPDLDTQWVRVFPIEPTLQPTTSEPLAAVVRSTDLATGETRVWADTVLRAREGGYAHLYFAPFRPAYEHAYRVEVSDEEGDAASAQVQVPRASALVLRPPGRAAENLFVGAGESQIINTRATYHVRYAPVPEAELRYVFSYRGEHRREGDGWRLTIDLARDAARIVERLRTEDLLVPSFGVELLDLSLHLSVVDPSWRPPGDDFVFDPNVLVEPGILTNVENGFGFIGAGYRLSHSWLPSAQTRREAGFRVDE